MTGRIFICLTNETDMVENFHDNFEAGVQYYEAMYDSDGMNDIKPVDTYILLINKNGLPLYVDTTDFMLIEREVNSLVLMPMCLN